MKSLKPILLSLTLLAAIATTIFYTSCEKNACDHVTCYNGGSCGTGTCRCPTGYEGSQCESRSTDRYTGVYAGFITCNNSAQIIDSAFITRGYGILDVDVRVKSLSPKILHGYVVSNESTYSIVVTNNDSTQTGSLSYLKVYTITLQSDNRLSVHTYEQNYTGLGDTLFNKCDFLGFKSL